MDAPMIDSALEAVAANKTRWARLPVATKIYLLDELRARVGQVAATWVETAAAAKGIPFESHLVGEEWTSGPYALAQGAADIADTLRRIRDGVPVLHGFPARVLPNGRLAVRVFPATAQDRLFLNAHTAEVWMQPGVTLDDLEADAAAFYRDPNPVGSLTVVLGAGNIASIAPLDVLTELFNAGSVVVVKLNPVNAYLKPFFEHVFGPLIDAGFVAFVAGGAAEGAYLTRHEQVDHIHVTGAATTHDAIVFGAGPDAARRKAADDPVIDIPVTSELGGVGPTIVVGDDSWSDADLRFQAEHLVSQKLHNHAFNCIACQVLILPEAWGRGDALIEQMRSVVAELPPRGAYYPGTDDRLDTALAAHPEADVVRWGDDPVAFITDLDPARSGDVCFRTEFFAPVLGVVRLPGSDPAAYLEQATRFANDTLEGNLGVNLIVHPATAREHPGAVERAVADLRYGTIAVNTWVGVAFAMNRAPWGAFPGNPRNDIRSGSGVVHNSLMLTRTERTVVRGAFAPFPRTLGQRVFHTETTPPFFVTHRHAAVLGRRLTERAVGGSWTTLPGIIGAAIRG